MATKEEIERAKRVDPTSFLESAGYTVKRQQKYLHVMRGSQNTYRITEKNGVFLFVGNDQKGGDNIDLYRRIDERASINNAVYALLKQDHGEIKNQAPQHDDPNKEKQIEFPVIKEARPELKEKFRQMGRKYLIEERLISKDTVDYAEKEGLLDYSKGGVLFLGKDENGNIRNIYRRDIRQDGKYGHTNFYNSDKTYSQVLKGNSDKIWIVEGGVDILAARDVALLEGKEHPTIIMSGGAGVHNFIKNNIEIKKMIYEAKEIVLWGENEETPAKQLQTDEAHEKQVEFIHHVRETKNKYTVKFRRPENEFKDLSEVLEGRMHDKYREKCSDFLIKTGFLEKTLDHSRVFYVILKKI